MDTTSISISQLKANPAKAIAEANDYPTSIQSRGTTKAYLIGKDIFEKLILYVENAADNKVINETNFSQGKDFEKIAKELHI